MPVHRTGRSLEQGTSVRHLRREHDQLVSRVEQCLGPLSVEHKALICIVLRHGGTFEQVARLRGEHATTVSRRFHRLLNNLSARGLPQCRPLSMNPLERAILAQYYLCGRGQAAIAEKLGVTRYRVRKTLDRIRTHDDENTIVAGGAA